MKFVLSIVTLHGIRGHALGPFLYDSEEVAKIWIRDFLPSDIPNCRVLTYGYLTARDSRKCDFGIQVLAKEFLETFMRFREATDVRSDPILKEAGLNLSQTATRPVIFIGHSMGGLIIQQVSQALQIS